MAMSGLEQGLRDATRPPGGRRQVLRTGHGWEVVEVLCVVDGFAYQVRDGDPASRALKRCVGGPPAGVPG